jgi:hypothetical protein
MRVRTLQRVRRNVRSKQAKAPFVGLVRRGCRRMRAIEFRRSNPSQSQSHLELGISALDGAWRRALCSPPRRPLAGIFALPRRQLHHGGPAHRWAACFELTGKIRPVRALPPTLPQRCPPHAPADSDLPRAAGRVPASLKSQAIALGF